MKPGAQAFADLEPGRVARAAVLPVPYEATVSYGAGTASGPGAVLEASRQVELYDEELGVEPYTVGIETLPPVAFGGRTGADAIDAIEREVAAGLDAGRFVVMLGGEHSITPAGVRAAAHRHDGLVVVQLDAHADLRDRYEGDAWSHASAMARCLDHATVRAVGIRSYSVDEARRIAGGIPGYRIVHGHDMASAAVSCGDDGHGYPAWGETILEGLEGRPVYLTIDVDYFDPAIVPATGTPEPGGGDWYGTLRFLRALFDRAEVVAADLVELAPIDGLHHPQFTVARLLYKLIGYRFRTELERASGRGAGS